MITLGFNRSDGARSRRRHSHFDIVLRMCEDIAAFMRENDGGEYKAFFSRDGGAVGLYLLTTSEQFNFELADKLSEFAAPYIERGLLGSVTLLPASTPEELAAYFDPNKALSVEIRNA